jgi:uncharacterized protein (TIGR02145 family)
MHNIFFAQNIGDSEGLGYGYLYNWYAASDANFPPTDWKVPSELEFQTLVTNLGGYSVAGGKLKEAGIDNWLTPNTGADNSSGFTSLPGGNRTTAFNLLGQRVYYWGVDILPKTGLLTIQFNSAAAENYVLFSTNQWLGQSIKLLYEGAGTPTTVTDNDGNGYDVVLIGSQYWTVQNWKCTTLSRTPFTTIPNVTDQTDWNNLTTLGLCAYDNDPENV